ncbi:MAG: DUF2207 domain-containing protein, partial [Coriobacteriaceae bacterium]|nr:DUF2207 domain-containing protein [Coriobacteriaceae bacterium]
MAARRTGNYSLLILILIVVIIDVGFTFFGSSLASCSSSTFSSKSRTITSEDMQVEVADDGTLSVSDACTYQFKGSWELVGVTLDPPDGGAYEVDGVRVIDEDGTKAKLKEVAFETSWRRSGGPGDGYYAIDAANDAVYIFTDSVDCTKTVVLDYTYTNAVAVYADVSELYWNYIGADWDIGHKDVDVTVSLPVPAGQTVAGGDNVQAWGHGELDGQVRFNEDGTVSFISPQVAAGQTCEMRIIYPAAWSPDVAKSQRSGTEMRETIVAEEQAWADEADHERWVARFKVIGATALALILIALAFILWHRYGREYKPNFDGKYWRDVPDKDLHPAVVARLWRWDKEDANDLTASLMHLSARGVVTLEQVEKRTTGVFGHEKVETDYKLVRHPERAVDLDVMDEKTLETVFDGIGDGEDAITMDEMNAAAEKYPDHFVNCMDSWQKTLTTQTDLHAFFESRGESLKSLFRVVAVVYAVLAWILFFTGFLDIYSTLISTCAAPIIFVVGLQMPRRSREAIEVYARSKGLKKWLEDFTLLDEGVPDDLQVWGEYLVYAYIFGIADKVAEAMKVAVPEVADDVYYGGYGGFWLWYYAPFVGGFGHGMAASFGHCIDRSFTMSRTATS